MALFFPGIERALDQILANQAWLKNALLVLTAKVNAIMANTEALEAAMVELEATADKVVIALEAIATQGGVNQEQVDALTARITAVTDKLTSAGAHVTPYKK